MQTLLEGKRHSVGQAYIVRPSHLSCRHRKTEKEERIMLEKKMQEKIYRRHRSGHSFTKGRRYMYSIQYNPMALVHTWIIRKRPEDIKWDWVQPLDPSIT